jgi:hypothetical protein
MFWYIDPAHSQVTFSVKHMMVSTVRGRLGKLSGRLELDPKEPEKADFEIGVDVRGIDTGDPKRDGHLRSGDFFDAEKHPEIVFKSNAIFPTGDGLRAHLEHAGAERRPRLGEREDRGRPAGDRRGGRQEDRSRGLAPFAHDGGLAYARPPSCHSAIQVTCRR